MPLIVTTLYIPIGLNAAAGSGEVFLVEEGVNADQSSIATWQVRNYVKAVGATLAWKFKPIVLDPVRMKQLEEDENERQRQQQQKQNKQKTTNP